MGRKFIIVRKTRFCWLLVALVLAVALAPGLAQAASVLTVPSGSTYDNTGTSAYDYGNIDGTANCNEGSLTFLTSNYGQLYLGTTSGVNGVFNLNTATPYTGSLAALYEYIGDVGSGTFTQGGGTNAVTDSLVLGYRTDSSGSYDLSGTGSLAAPNEYIGSAGSGTFTQSGGTNSVSNTLYLGNGYNSSGTYNFFGGSLSARAVSVNSGGVFWGFGTVESGTFTNSGRVAPGDAPGTLTINGGPYTQTASGTLTVDIASATNYAKLAVTGTPGTASLNGTVKPILLNGYIPQDNQVFPGVVTAAHGLTGTFSNIAITHPTLSWKPIYTANDVSLKVIRNYTAAGLALNDNELQVAPLLNSLADTTTGDLNTVLSAIDSLTTPSAVRNAYDQISPEKFGALPNLGFAVAYS